MASAQEPSNVRFSVVAPSGNKYELFTKNVAETGPGGSADGVIASTSTPDTWTVLPLNSNVIPANSRIIIEVNLITADGIDWSDCALSLPVRRANNAPSTLINSDFTGTDLVAATTAGTWHQLAYYDTPAAMRVGGGPMFFSVEDDTA
jgi:hypothetical protein